MIRSFSVNDAKEHIFAASPKRGGACYLCGAALDISPSIEIQVQVPLFKFKGIIQRGCLACAKDLRALLDLRIVQAEKGEFQS